MSVTQVMDTRNWDQSVSYFQAHARGFLVRKEVRHAREDFEDIVKEIDGGLAHLEWRETILSIPHFKDTDGPFLQGSCSGEKHLDPEAIAGAGAGASSHSPATPGAGGGAAGEHGETLVAERDEPDAQHQPCADSPEGGGGGRVETAGQSTDVWSSLEQDTDLTGAQEVPLHPQALRLHRNSLAMELVWLQQAIDSRKKYLSLKENLSVS